MTLVRSRKVRNFVQNGVQTRRTPLKLNSNVRLCSRIDAAAALSLSLGSETSPAAVVEDHGCRLLNPFNVVATQATDCFSLCEGLEDENLGMSGRKAAMRCNWNEVRSSEEQGSGSQLRHMRALRLRY